MRLKKLCAGLLCAGMALTMTACGGSDEPKEAKTDKITIWAWDDTFNIKAAKDAADLYKKDNADLEVEIVTMAQDDIIQKLNTSLSSGKTDGLPNIVLIEDYRIQNYLTAYPEEFSELTDIVKKEDFMDYKFAVNSIDDKIYGLPFDSGVAGLFYRLDYIEQAGYTAKDMENITWDEYIEIGKAVKEKTGHAMLTLDPSDLGQIRMMLQSAGSWYVKEDGETVDIENNEALKSAITVYKKLIDSGIVEQVADWDSFVGAFQKGNVASVPTGCWIGSSIMKTADQSGKWGIAPLPRLADVKSSVNASSIGGGGWYVLKNVAGADTAKDFLSKTFATSKDLMNTLAKDINLVSTYIPAAETENYKAESEFFSNQKIFENFSAWSEMIPSVNYGLHTYAIEDILTESVQAVVNGADIDSSLKTAQQNAEGAIVK
ncbi:ABC transporter substrate-binding protein [Amedibacillus sp. YH-ame10]